jgi:hypothetical protein
MMNEKINPILSSSHLDEPGVCRSIDMKNWSRQLSALHGHCSRIE